MEDGSFIIETRQIGGFLRVTALDPTTLAEVHFQAPLTCSPEEIERVAGQKLAYLLRRRHGRKPTAGSSGIIA